MKREADNNRVKRSMEHVKAAITNLKSIKPDNMSLDEEDKMKYHIDELERVWRQMDKFLNGEDEDEEKPGAHFCIECFLYHDCEETIGITSECPSCRDFEPMPKEDD